MHFGYVHNLCTTSFFQNYSNYFLVMFHFAIFVFDKLCEILQK